MPVLQSLQPLSQTEKEGLLSSRMNLGARMVWPLGVLRLRKSLQEREFLALSSILRKIELSKMDLLKE